MHIRRPAHPPRPRFVESVRLLGFDFCVDGTGAAHGDCQLGAQELDFGRETVAVDGAVDVAVAVAVAVIFVIFVVVTLVTWSRRVCSSSSSRKLGLARSQKMPAFGSTGLDPEEVDC